MMENGNFGDARPPFAYSTEQSAPVANNNADIAEALVAALQRWAQSTLNSPTHISSEGSMMRRQWPRPSLDADGSENQESLLAAIAEADYANRRRRDKYIHADIFAEPAWDILLDLYVQHSRKRAVSVHSLCIAAAVPATTALRWIAKLGECGLVTREPSPDDNRVIYVSLTEKGLGQMEQYLCERLSRTRMGLPMERSYS